MKQYLVPCIFGLAIIGFITCGCATVKEYLPLIKSIGNDNISIEEKTEAIAQLEEYIKQLKFRPTSSINTVPQYFFEDYNNYLNSRDIPHYDMETIKKISVHLSIGKVFLDETPNNDILKQIRDNYELCLAKDNNQNLYLANNPLKIKQLAEKQRRVEGNPLSNWFESYTTSKDFILLTSTENLCDIPSYLHFISKEGREKRISICQNKFKIGFGIVITPTLQTDNKTINVEYVIKHAFISDDRKAIVPYGKQGLEKLDKDIRVVESVYRNNIAIPEGKSLAIECTPTGSTLSEKDIRKRLIVFIACTRSDNPIKATESTMTTTK